jgi:DNA modification methylase
MHETLRAFTNSGRNQLGDDQGKAGGAVPNASIKEGLAYPSNVLAVNFDSHDGDGSGHSAAYPVNLPTFFIRAFSDENDIVYDPFLGSGTTLIAAEQLGRKCYGMEISPAYCDVIIQRWENLTGNKARKV